MQILVSWHLFLMFLNHMILSYNIIVLNVVSCLVARFAIVPKKISYCELMRCLDGSLARNLWKPCDHLRLGLRGGSVVDLGRGAAMGKSCHPTRHRSWIEFTIAKGQSYLVWYGFKLQVANKKMMVLSRLNPVRRIFSFLWARSLTLGTSVRSHENLQGAQEP